MRMDHHHTHDPVLIVLSIVIAIFASYIALDLANCITAARGRARSAWLLGGSMAMGAGIWSMHFVGMLAFSLPGTQIAYDVFLLILSVLVAISASALALFIISRKEVTHAAFVLGSLTMGAAISGMHYIGIASMRMNARWEWNYTLVVASIVIAITASFVALQLAFRLRNNMSRQGFLYRAAGGIVMGLAISGMHYTAMAAMTFFPFVAPLAIQQEHLLATSGLAISVVGTTLLILGIALTGSIVDRALARREATIQSRDEFLSVASHELKTPITSLNLQVHIRQKKVAKGDMAAFTLEKLKVMFDSDARQFKRLSRLIDDMLDITRMSTGKLTINCEQFDLCELTKEVIERHLPQFENAGYETELEICPPVHGCWDRFRIEQVFTNLFTNAVKYGAGKPMRIKLERIGDSKARFSVTDQGMGIARNDQERVFQRFERAVSPNEIPGLGLGLYITKQIVEMHKGRIWVESEVGKGATFYVELPLNQS